MTGLDIGSKTIKIVELQKEGNGFALSASGIVGYSGNSVDKLVDDKEYADLGSVVKHLHNEAGVSSKDVVISVPESQVFTRTIRFPMLTDSEIASAIKWESEQYIPIPVAEAVIQHSILERNEKTSPPEVLVLLVAAPKVVVERYTKVVEAAGLTPVAVETELIALTRALAPVDKTVLITDFGATSTDIAIVKNGLLSFSRSIPIAGEAFTRAVSQGLGISAPQAEEYKKTYGLSSKELEGKIKGALDPVLRMVVDEIKKAINYYQTEEKGDSPKAIIISGGTSGMREIVSALSSLLGLEVLVGNPFIKTAVDPDTAKRLAPYASLYSVAVGLAMRGE
ncbi:MAG: type IV pilus assembly protein PilM [Microgenomates group bacterium GW2011_GWC1_39_7b]|uniref:Type IV pilus assembly protein PilM n=2 Tax=Candidatus Woeseibacteriota TaxID=1752722 RepID=A0A0G0X7I1_9BACT|nr:MAG: type IV pilus assembly protein PilM [Candidatus Woesebacteria bacterium GW2011_GWB1_39_10]KKR26632.1 MAG: type IV pilus assembly protein PilM [Microgenomates group bacterium GW2011_GWC1_39_7b]KKR92595.1 MAG: type IV pilus assembly protein PilM [Candidatus Woesebacteria bacterium GW2011_GWA1_41_13b]